MDNQKEGSLRLLTSGEIRLAKSIFGDSIHYHKVWIHHGSYLPDQKTMQFFPWN